MSADEHFMKQCIQLALQSLGKVAPNPLVGSIIVHDGKIIGEGRHEFFGGPHAEVNAINSVIPKRLLAESTLYVNLEPCSHFGKTPPCADLIIEKKIKRVVIGMTDPNPLVNGKGIEKLKKAGIEVVSGILEKECIELNKRFLCSMQNKRPYIILKWAQSSDGFIDKKRSKEDVGKQAQISNNYSQILLHKWRSEEQAIMVGTNTALMDNPRLTLRHWSGNPPLRIFIDKWLRIPRSYNLYDKSVPTLVFTEHAREAETNLEFCKIDFSKNILQQIVDALHHKQIQSVIIEGGELFLKSFIEQGLWDEARVIVSPTKLEKGISAPVILHKVSAIENIKGDELMLYKNL